MADRGACAGADAAFLHGLRGGGDAAAVSAVGSRPDARIADAEIEQDRRGHDRHARDADVEADSTFFEPADDARSGVEAERAAAGEHDRVHFFTELIGDSRSVSRVPGADAAHVHPGDGAIFCQHDRAAGRALGEREVSDLDAVNSRQRLIGGGLGGLRERSRCTAAASRQRSPPLKAHAGGLS